MRAVDFDTVETGFLGPGGGIDVAPLVFLDLLKGQPARRMEIRQGRSHFVLFQSGRTKRTIALGIARGGRPGVVELAEDLAVVSVHSFHKFLHAGKILVIIQRAVDSTRMRGIPENPGQKNEGSTAFRDAFVEIDHPIGHEVVRVPVHGGLGGLDHPILQDHLIGELDWG